MMPSKLTLIALATAFSIGAANADEPLAPEVIVVTAPKPETVETREVLAVETQAVAPHIDYTSLAIEAPKLERTDSKKERGIEVVLSDTGNSKS